MTPTCLNALGLSLNMLGTVLWFFFGLSAVWNPTGMGLVGYSRPDPTEVRARRSLFCQSAGWFYFSSDLAAEFAGCFCRH